MNREPASERKAWVEARQLFDAAHDELMRQIEALVAQVADEEDNRER